MSHRLAIEFKKLFENIAPDLRETMRPSFSGKVVSADEDAYTVDIEVEDKSGGQEGDPWLLPAVPVSAAAGGDGWGLYAIPEIGSEVTFTFKNFDITDPRVDGAEFLSNRTPLGARAGSFVLADRSGQRVVLRPDTGTMIFQGYNVDDEAAGSRSERTAVNKVDEVLGDRVETTGGNVKRTVDGNVEETVNGKLSRVVTNKFEEHAGYEDGGKFYQRGVIVHGAQRTKIKGGHNVRIGGDRSEVLLGHDRKTVAGSVEQAIGGHFHVMCAGMKADASLPTNPMDLISVQIGGTGICNWGGIFVPGVSQSMVHGDVLKVVLQVILVFMNLGGIVAPTGGGPCTINPAYAPAFSSLLSFLQAPAGIPALPTAPLTSTRNYVSVP